MSETSVLIERFLRSKGKRTSRILKDSDVPYVPAKVPAKLDPAQSLTFNSRFAYDRNTAPSISDSGFPRLSAFRYVAFLFFRKLLSRVLIIMSKRHLNRLRYTKFISDYSILIIYSYSRCRDSNSLKECKVVFNGKDYYKYIRQSADITLLILISRVRNFVSFLQLQLISLISSLYRTN